MATNLVKPVTRQLMGTKVREGKYKNYPVTVTLEPGDVITFRIKGTRQTMDIALSQCFHLAMLIDVEHRYRKAMETYKEKKKVGYKGLRKPKRSALPFSKIYFDATK